MIGYHAVRGDRGRVHEGHPRLRRRRRRSRRWWPARATGPTAAWRTTCSSATCRSTRKARRPPRRSSTPSTTGRIARMARAMGAHGRSPRSSTKRAANWRNAFDPADRLHARAASATAASASPFDPTRQRLRQRLHRGQRLAVLVVRAAGRRRPRRRRYGGARPAAGAAGRGVRCQDRPEGVRPHGGHHRPHRLVRARQRAEPPHRLPVRRRRAAVAHAGAPGAIMDSQYAPRPDGLAGNDDLGQMSAWYLFTALGFYPVAPASNEYILGRPFVHARRCTCRTARASR